MAAAALLLIGASAMWAPTEARPKWDNHCTSPDGLDLNELYGIPQQIVSGFCPEVNAGERWTAPGAPWIMNQRFGAVPAGFVPAGDTPLEDFVAKFVAIKYVIDAGTAHETTLIYPSGPDLWVGTFELDFGSGPEEFPAVNPAPLSSVRPLSIGEHTVHTYWVFGSLHCDGFAAVIEENCLGPGETLYRFGTLEVTRGAAQSIR
jgi:hypothetical protein